MDKIYDDGEMYSARFACSCLHPAHSLDVVIEFLPDKKVDSLLLEFSERYICGQMTFKEKLSNAWKLLRGEEIYDHSIYIRAEDVQDLINLLKKALPSNEEGK